MNLSELQTLVLTVVGGVGAIIIGVLGLTNPPVLATGDTLSVALIIAGLAALGIGPIRSAYSAARADK